MAAQQHLPKAPITEAVIDFLVQPQPGATISDLQSAMTDKAFDYPTVTPIWQSTFGISLNADPKAAKVAPTGGAPQQIGLRAQSADATYVAMLRTNGFGLSRLVPYQDWDHLEAEARRIWEIYFRRFKVVKVTRVATRFINNLNLPMHAGQSFEDYIFNLIELPAALPQMVNNFVQQFQIVDPDTGNSARLAMAWDGHPGKEGRVPIILDIDVSRQLEFAPDDPKLWEALVSMRVLKNRCFFGLLTDTAIKHYL
jgi:uncharacterized protein (TIGR04255 family)